MHLMLRTIAFNLYTSLNNFASLLCSPTTRKPSGNLGNSHRTTDLRTERRHIQALQCRGIGAQRIVALVGKQPLLKGMPAGHTQPLGAGVDLAACRARCSASPARHRRPAAR